MTRKGKLFFQMLMHFGMTLGLHDKRHKLGK